MIFNITLFVQMIHFGIAYVMLKYLFFIPILLIIKTKKDIQIKMEQAIIGLEDSLVTLKKQQRRELDILKAHFVSHLPKVAHVQDTLTMASQVEIAQQRTEDIEELYRFKEDLKHILNQKLHG
jgi:hypothetical protein